MDASVGDVTQIRVDEEATNEVGVSVASHGSNDFPSDVPFVLVDTGTTDAVREWG
jgi:hypothetical protein